MFYDLIAQCSIELLSLVYTVTILIIYLRKKKIMSIDNYVFTFMFICTSIDVFLDAATILIAGLTTNEAFIIFVNRLYTLALDYWLISFALYTILLFKKDNKYNVPLKEDPNKGVYFRLIRIAIIITVVVTILNFILPMNISPDRYWLVEGLAVYLSYLIYAVCMIILIVCTVRGLKKLSRKTYMAVLLYTGISLLSIVISILAPDVFIFSFITGFVTSLMYFTLENPDLSIIEEINIAKLSAERANRAKSEFLANMSNEIKTPLNAIVGFARALREEKLTPKALDETNQIMDSANNLLDIVNDILDISKIESGRIEFAQMDYDSVRLFEGLIENISDKLEKKSIKFNANIDSNLPPVLCGDIYRIKQIVLNLLTNAVKFTNEGLVTYTVKGERVDNDICKLTIIVEDTGKGIETDDVDKVFLTFQRLDIVENNELLGTGLGLAITKDLVTLMKGTIDVESELGKGTKFTVVLYQPISKKELSEIDMSIDSDYKPFDAQHCRVIVVDDNNINLRVAKQLFKEYNLEPELTNSGEELLSRILAGNKYDLIFLDEVMPKINGTEILKKLKELNNFDTPVIALTADQGENARDNFLQSGFNNYLAKPIIKEQLYIIMKQYLIPRDDSSGDNEGTQMVKFEL